MIPRVMLVLLFVGSARADFSFDNVTIGGDQNRLLIDISMSWTNTNPMAGSLTGMAFPGGTFNFNFGVSPFGFPDGYKTISLRPFWSTGPDLGGFLDTTSFTFGGTSSYALPLAGTNFSKASLAHLDLTTFMDQSGSARFQFDFTRATGVPESGGTFVMLLLATLLMAVKARRSSGVSA